MDVLKFMGSTFLKLEEFNGPRKEQISDVDIGDYDKLVLHFNSGDKLSLNATNTRTLARAYGRDSRDWINQTVELYVGQVQFKGALQDSILVRPVSPPIPPEKQRTPEPSPEPTPEPTKIDDEIPF